MKIKTKKIKKFLDREVWRISLYALSLVFILGLGAFVFLGGLGSPKIVFADHNVAIDLNNNIVKEGSSENYVFGVANEGVDNIYKITIKSENGFEIDVDSIECPENWIVNFKSDSSQAVCMTDPDPEKESVLLAGDNLVISFSAIAPEPNRDTEYAWEVYSKDTNWGLSVNKTATTLVYVDENVSGGSSNYDNASVNLNSDEESEGEGLEETGSAETEEEFTENNEEENNEAVEGEENSEESQNGNNGEEESQEEGEVNDSGDEEVWGEESEDEEVSSAETSEAEEEDVAAEEEISNGDSEEANSENFSSEESDQSNEENNLQDKENNESDVDSSPNTDNNQSEQL